MKKTLTATATAPGHITGLFIPQVDSPDLLSRGSLGAGIVLDRGAVAKVSVSPSSKASITMKSRGRKGEFPVTLCALKKVLEADGRLWRVTVELSHDLPISHGLGMSAAGTLAAAMALSRDLGQPLALATKSAHMAELECHGGLGGVPAILGGGIEVRRRAGLPPSGRVERTRRSGRILLAFQEDAMPSPPLLSDPRFLEKVRRSGKGLLEGLSSPPLSLQAFMMASSQFTDAMAFTSPLLKEAIDQLRADGYLVAQAMLGPTLFVLVVPSGDGPASPLSRHPLEVALNRLGLHTVMAGIGPRGARMLDGPSPG